MKRNVVFALAVMILLSFSLVFLPASSAKRNVKESKRKAPVAKKTLSEADLFKPGGQGKSMGKATVSQAVNFGESIPVRDMARITAKGKRSRMRDRELAEEEKGVKGDENNEGLVINEENREIIRNIDPTAPGTPDAAIAHVPSNKNSHSPLVMPAPNVSFEGISEPDTEALGQGFLPPDTNGEIGPNHYVQTVNSAFRIYSRTGTALIPLTSLGTLFGSIPGACAGNEDGDPVVVYDQLADRWLISEFCTVANPNSHQLIAVSKTGDPTGAYYLYDFMMPNNDFNDYPKFGVWPDAYYMTDNEFDQAGTQFLGAGAFAFNRAKMIIGDPTASFVYFDLNAGCPADCVNGGMLPGDLDGLTPPPVGAPNTFMQFDADEFGGGRTDSLRIYDFHVDFTVTANSTLSERAGSPLAVAAFDPREVPSGSRNVVPQPPGGIAVDVISDRLMFRLAYRNYGNHESLALNHSVNAATNPLFRAGVRYYELQRTTPASAWTVHEQATMAGGAGDAENRWMGGTALNAAGSQAVGYSVSSATVFPSIRYAGRLAGDPAGSLGQGEATLVAGAGVQTHSSGRWGDYSDLTVDPNDDCTFWYTQEYYPATGSAPWHTRIGSFTFGPCPAVPKGTIQGTITNCQTGLPVPNALVTATGGFLRGTDASGNYSMLVPAGTYNATATTAGYDTLTGSGLVVPDGGSVTFSGCLNGNLKQPVADTASITVDSCNSNGTIDPNENVTVSFGIKNTGTLNTANLVATLQATGGVTSPSGPQNYGVVVAGGSTVFRSFTFTAGNLACGAPLIATLQLQDGATNLGTITYNFVTGALAVNNYSSGNISVAIPDSPAPAVDIPITVADVMTLTDVNVSFRINHTFDGDLTISLVHPDNTVIPLVTNRGSSGANFGTGTLDCAGGPTFIDDQAAVAISAGAAPFTSSSFRPESPLSALNGKASNGIWKLRVQDTANLDTGTVGCVKLELNKHFVCCGALINAAPPPVITAESVAPANNAADPEETVTVNLAVVNVGGSPTSNLVATLQPTGGVAGPSGPQNYGVVVNSGPAVTRPFTFTAQGTCGSSITLSLALQDGPTNLGTVTYTMTLGTLSSVTIFSENFDGVSAPVLPAGWTTTHTGSELDWVTSATNPNSAPNDAFAPDVSTVGNTELVTPTINVPVGGGQLTFKNLFNLEGSTVTPTTGFDGMVLELSINGGAFADITTGGNAFTAGGYTRTISGSFSNPLANRLAWSGLSGGTTAAPTYITSTINLPATAAGQPIKLKWRVGTDTSSVAAGAAGVRIDNIQVTGSSPVCNSQSCTITAPVSVTIPPGTCGTVVNYSPAVQFTGSCGVVVGPNPPSGSFFGIGTTTVFVRGTRADASFTDASFPVTVQDSETQATGLGALVTNNYCDTTVKYTAVTGAGSTTVVDAPQQSLPSPYVHCPSCPELNITTTATFTAPVTTCITMPASTSFATFSQLRILHGEPGLINRTTSSNFGTKTICAQTNSVSPFVVALNPTAPTAAPGTISGQVTTADGEPLAGVAMRLAGQQSASAITDSEGNYCFENVGTDSFYTVTPVLANHHFSPSNRSFSLLGTKTDAVFTASADAVATTNPIDTNEYFVRQQYLDFLGREPDFGGFNFWLEQLNQCNSDAGCLRTRRLDVSAAFFTSEEFKDTGAYVYKLYEAGLGRQVNYEEFVTDRQQVLGGESLSARKTAFARAFVGRAEFMSRYQASSTAESFVDALLQSASSASGVNLSGERAGLISRYNAGATKEQSRALVLQELAENASLSSAANNPSFVLMEYFGFLRRDVDPNGYAFWLNVLNNREPGNYRGMVCSFITSTEYLRRFSTVVSHTNAECGP